MSLKISQLFCLNFSLSTANKGVTAQWRCSNNNYTNRDNRIMTSTVVTSIVTEYARGAHSYTAVGKCKFNLNYIFMPIYYFLLLYY